MGTLASSATGSARLSTAVDELRSGMSGRPLANFLRTVGFGGGMAREPRLTEVFDRDEEVEAKQVAENGENEKTVDLAHQYYGEFPSVQRTLGDTRTRGR